MIPKKYLAEKSAACKKHQKWNVTLSSLTIINLTNIAVKPYWCCKKRSTVKHTRTERQ